MMRFVAAALCVLQGVLNAACFIGAWSLNGSDAGFRAEPWIFTSGIFLSDPVGKLFGLLSLVALGAFAGAAYAFLAEKPWWRSMLIMGASVSLITVLPWWNTWQPLSLVAVLAVDVLSLLVSVVPSRSARVA